MHCKPIAACRTERSSHQFMVLLPITSFPPISLYTSPTSLIWLSSCIQPISSFFYLTHPLQPGSVVVELSPGMRALVARPPGRVKQKTLKFEVLLVCLALSTCELETDWRLGVRIMACVGTSLHYPWRGVSVG